MRDYDYGGYDCNECRNAEREIARLERKLAAAGAPDPAAIAAAKADGATAERERIVRGLRRRVLRWQGMRHIPGGITWYAWHEPLDIAEQIEAGAGDWSPEADHLEPGAGK